MIKCWVRLGTAGMNWNLSLNNQAAWNTVGGKTFTSSDGLNTTTYTQLLFTFVCPSTTNFAIHVGSHSNTNYGQAAQITGTSYVYGWQILVKNTTGTLTSSLYVDGAITVTTPVAVGFYGVPALYNTSGILQATGFTTVNQTFNVRFPSNVNQNWTPSYTSTVRLTVPFTGLYVLQFTFSSGTGTTFFQFITKNLGNGNEVATWDDKVLASSCPGLGATYTNSISATAFLRTTDYLCFSIFPLSGSITYYNRCNAHATLIQRTG